VAGREILPSREYPLCNSAAPGVRGTHLGDRGRRGLLSGKSDSWGPSPMRSWISWRVRRSRRSRGAFCCGPAVAEDRANGSPGWSTRFARRGWRRRPNRHRFVCHIDLTDRLGRGTCDPCARHVDAIRRGRSAGLIRDQRNDGTDLRAGPAGRGRRAPALRIHDDAMGRAATERRGLAWVRCFADLFLVGDSRERESWLAQHPLDLMAGRTAAWAASSGWTTVLILPGGAAIRCGRRTAVRCGSSWAR